MATTIAPKPQAPTPAPGPQELTALFTGGLSKPGRRILSNILARVAPEDRDDVLQSARAWCWSRRMFYDLITGVPTEAWFLGAVRDAKKQLLRDRRQHADVKRLGGRDVPQGDTTVARVEAAEAAEKLAAALPEDYRRVAQLESEHDYSRKELQQLLGVPKHVIDDARARVQQLRRLMPDDHDEHKVARPTPPRVSSDDLEPFPERSWIDREIAARDRPDSKPKQRTPSPGELAAEARRLLPRVEDPDVRAALERTEARRSRKSGQMDAFVPFKGWKGKQRSLLDGRRGAQRKERCSK